MKFSARDQAFVLVGHLVANYPTLRTSRDGPVFKIDCQFTGKKGDSVATAELTDIVVVAEYEVPAPVAYEGIPIRFEITTKEAFQHAYPDPKGWVFTEDEFSDY